MSIYYIDDLYRDDVVVTLEMTSRSPDTTGLVKVNLGGSVAYGTQTDGYSLLTFRLDDILYTLTCRHDINTLIRLGNALI
jgi:hypothetical protein